MSSNWCVDVLLNVMTGKTSKTYIKAATRDEAIRKAKDEFTSAGYLYVKVIGVRKVQT